MRAQVQRVADAWELLETKTLLGRISSYTDPADGNNPTFKSIDIKKKWLDWMKNEHKIQLDRLQAELDKRVEVFKGKPSIITRLKRWEYHMIFHRAIDEPNCGSEADPNKMDERVQLLIKEYGAMDRIDSELKLD
jgi:hypothetical protein